MLHCFTFVCKTNSRNFVNNTSPPHFQSRVLNNSQTTSLCQNRYQGPRPLTPQPTYPLLTSSKTFPHIPVSSPSTTPPTTTSLLPPPGLPRAPVGGSTHSRLPWCSGREKTPREDDGGRVRGCPRGAPTECRRPEPRRRRLPNFGGVFESSTSLYRRPRAHPDVLVRPTFHGLRYRDTLSGHTDSWVPTRTSHVPTDTVRPTTTERTGPRTSGRGG